MAGGSLEEHSVPRACGVCMACTCTQCVGRDAILLGITPDLLLLVPTTLTLPPLQGAVEFGESAIWFKAGKWPGQQGMACQRSAVPCDAVRSC